MERYKVWFVLEGGKVASMFYLSKGEAEAKVERVGRQAALATTLSWYDPPTQPRNHWTALKELK